MTNTLLYFKVP